MGTIEKRPGSPTPWRARWRDPQGRTKSKQFRRRTDAEAHLIAMSHSMLTGAYVAPSAGKVTFAAYAAQWLADQTFDTPTSEQVASRIKVHMVPTLGKRELRSITPGVVQSWVRNRSNVLAPRTVRVTLTNLSTILGAAVDDGRIVKNPCLSSSVKPPKIEQRLIVPWTFDQVFAVRDALPARYQVMASVASGLGLRQGEVFGLRVADVDFLRRVVHVRQQVRLEANRPVFALPKGGKERDVPLPEVVAIALAEHLRKYPTDDGPILTSREGKPLNRNYVNHHIWKPALLAAGTAPTRANGMHALRHFYASVALEGGTSVRALAEYMGHADPGYMLKVYAHLMPTSEDRARDAIDGAFAAAIEDREQHEAEW